MARRTVKRTLTDYIENLKFIRQYTTGFSAKDGYNIRDAANWSPAKKKQITRYNEILRKATTRPTYRYKPRRGDHLQIAKDSAGLTSLPKLNAVPLQVPTRYDRAGRIVAETPRVLISARGVLRLEFKNFSRNTLLFEDFGITPEMLAVDAAGAVAEMLNQTDFKRYGVITGEFEKGVGTPDLYLPDELLEEILWLMEEYNADEYDPDDPNSKYFGNWLFGLVGYDFPTLKDTLDYRAAYSRFRTEKEKLNTKIKSKYKTIERAEDRTVELERKIKKINMRRSLSAQDKAKLKKPLEKKIRENDKKIQGHKEQIYDWRLKMLRL